MNERFYLLPEEKQQTILNAAYRVFSQNTYKNSPMSEIAETAGISKSLLFHYFRNKKELYLYLWDHCAEITLKTLKEYGCYEAHDMFTGMELGTKAKISLMRAYPDMSAFTLKAFYETDEEIGPAIQERYRKQYSKHNANKKIPFDPSQFIEGLDLSMMYKDMYWASEGYIWELMQKGMPDTDELEKQFSELISFWKKIYLKKEKTL